LWATDFSSGGLVQWFGEVAGEAQPGSEMGDGLLPSEEDAAVMVNLEVENASGDSQAASVSADSLTDPPVYQLNVLDAGFAFGGPGYGNPVAECATCASLLANCGVVEDRCGNSISCGTCVSPQNCGGSGQPNVCQLPDGGMGGLPWVGGYSDGGVSTASDAGAKDAGSTVSSNLNPNGGSGCSSSGGSGSILLVAAALELMVPRRRLSGH